jgi:ADP-heptose:LPS heptosyltransferase
MTIVILILNAIGDGFLAQSSIINLIKKHHKDRVVLIIPSDLANTVFKYLPVEKVILDIDRNYFYPYYNFHHNLQNLSAQLNSVDILYCLTKFNPLPDYDLKIIATLRPKITYQFNKLEIIELKHSFEKYINFLKSKIPLNEIIIFRCPIIPPDYEKEMNNHIVTLSKIKPFIVFHTDTAEPKQWNLEGWKHLLQKFTVNYDIILIGRPKSEVLNLFHSFGAKIVKPDWHLSCLFIKHATFFVGIDSCFAHVADSYEKKGLVIWGESTEKSEYDKLLRQYEFGYLCDKINVIYNNLPTCDIPYDIYDSLLFSPSSYPKDI